VNPGGGLPNTHAGSAYAELIKDQLLEERSRKASIEQRGLAVITTSGGITSLLLGLALLVTADGSPLSIGALLSLAAAVVLFVAAAVEGLWANWPRPFMEARPDELSRLVTLDYWSADPLLGEMRSAEARIGILKTARDMNDRKVSTLAWAIRLEVIAILVVSVSVVLILASAW